MKQYGHEMDDPLRRIQEEIDAVARRERQLREEMLEQQQLNCKNCLGSNGMPVGNGTSPIHVEGSAAKKTVLSKTFSAPHLFIGNRRRHPGQKGLMQRFIESRGKLLSQSNSNLNNIAVNGKEPTSVSKSAEIVETDPLDFFLSTTDKPNAIERDEEGRPIRRGYVPADVKIQNELHDLKIREIELKRLRRELRKSNPELFCGVENEDSASDEEYPEEHCCSPDEWKKASQRNREYCTSTIQSPPPKMIIRSPDIGRKAINQNGTNLRPARSLAQLCDLDPEETPSSHLLINKFEKLIKNSA